MNNPPCLVCKQHRDTVKLRFLRAVKVHFFLIATNIQFINFQVPCCDECAARGKRIYSTRMWILLTLIFSPWLFLALAYWIEIWMGFRPGSGGLMCAVGLLWVLCFLGFWIAMNYVTPKWTRDFLGSDLDWQLRQRAGIRNWGAANKLLVLDKLPKKREPFVPWR
jgi:hypothetical protein